jgi:hypothetical protein
MDVNRRTLGSPHDSSTFSVLFHAITYYFHDTVRSVDLAALSDRVGDL